MTTDKIKLDLEKQFIQEIFDTAGLTMPEFISQKELKTAFTIIKDKLPKTKPTASTAISTIEVPIEAIETKSAKTEPIENSHPSVDLSKKYPLPNESNLKRPKTVLIVDDLGIIIHQLSILFKRLNFEVTTSQEIADAIEKYKSKDFGYAILDLYIPTEREGLYLVDEIKKMSLLCKLDTKIIVMSANTKEIYKVKARQRGADSFVEKAQGWQKKLIEECIG